MININYFLNAARVASKPLLRDYTELEKLQTSPRGVGHFVKKAMSRTRDMLDRELPSGLDIVWLEDSIQEQQKNIDPERSTAFIKTLDGIVDFARSFPFFGFLIYYKKGSHYGIVISLPAFNIIIFCHKGAGLFLEDTFGVARKLRISQPVMINPRIVATNISDYEIVREPIHKLGQHPQKHDFCSQIQQSSVKYFDSSLYALCALALSKVDLFVSDSTGIIQEVEQHIISEGSGSLASLGHLSMYGHSSLLL